MALREGFHPKSTKEARVEILEVLNIDIVVKFFLLIKPQIILEGLFGILASMFPHWEEEEINITLCVCVCVCRVEPGGD